MTTTNAPRSAVRTRRGRGTQALADAAAATFVEDLGLPDVTVTAHAEHENGRFVFTLTRAGASCDLHVTGADVAEMSFTGADGQDPLDYSPVIYNGEPLKWLTAIHLAHVDLGGPKATSIDEHKARMNAGTR